MNIPEHIMFEGKRFIKGLNGVPDFPEYKNTKSDDWYWLEGSKKEENRFLWHKVGFTDSKKWK